MRLATILDPSCVILDVGKGDKREILGRLAAPLADRHPDLDHDALLRELVAREEASSTAIADGIAIPHAKAPTGDSMAACFGRSPSGVDFDSLDGKPTRFLVVLVSPKSRPELHVAWLAHVAGLLARAEVRSGLLAAATVEDVLATLGAAEAAREREAKA